MTGDGNATERLAAYFDDSPDGLLVVESGGTIVQANERSTELFGYEVDELVGEPIELLVPEVIRDDHPEMRDAYFAKPSPRPMGAGLDLQAERADGTTFPVDISLSPIHVNGDMEVVAAVRDITYQRSLQRKYRSLLDTAPDAAVVANADTGEILEVNEMAVALFGRDEADLVGAHVERLHPPGETERYRDLFRAHVAAGQVNAIAEFRGDPLFVQPADGDPIPVEISARATQVEGQNVIMGIFRDISTRRAHERELARQLDRVETLTHVLAHDVRNPLNVASGRLDLARQTGDLDHLDHISQAHARIEEIVNDALTLIRDGFDVEYVEPLDLRTVATECWDAVETDAATLEVPTTTVIAADPRRIRHLFENLFRNSVEHGSTDNRDASRLDDSVEHGVPDTRAASLPDDVDDAGSRVTITVAPTADGFSVSDDGPGIPPEVRGAIFEPGWSTNTDGTGLGLTIVHDVAAAHGWRTEVDEAPGGGTRFTFSGVTMPDDAATLD